MSKILKKNSDWKGYTMDELAYQRALTLARIEMTKERMASDFDHVKKGNIFLSGSWFSRIMKMIDYTDIFVIGLTLWRKISPVFSRRKSKN